MESIFSGLKNYSKEKAVETETEVEKTILYVAPLLFIFFTSKQMLNFWGYSCVILLLVAMILAFINLTILRKLFIVTFNNALASEQEEEKLEDYKKGKIGKDAFGELPNTKEITKYRNWFNKMYYLSSSAFGLSIICLIIFIFTKS